MSQESHQFLAILEAPLAHVEPFYFPPDQLLGVEGGVPWLDEERAKHDLENIWGDGGLLRRL